MPAQKRDTKKNFIAILSEPTEPQHAAERPAKTDRRFFGPPFCS